MKRGVPGEGRRRRRGRCGARFGRTQDGSKKRGRLVQEPFIPEEEHGHTLPMVCDMLSWMLPVHWRVGSGRGAPAMWTVADVERSGQSFQKLRNDE